MGRLEIAFGVGLYMKEEELKRLRAAIAGDGAYHEIGFSYDNDVENFEPVGPKVEEPEDELYETPPGLDVPKGMEVPYNMKIHAIIEKTASFVSEQGGQMEIIIKMKQQDNPQFAFMHLDNPLYPYYKFLVKEIKSGSYKPIQTKKVVQSEDEDDDGHYLHPSLLSGKKDVPQFTLPSINFRRSQDDSYSVLVRNLQQQLAEEKQAREEQLLKESNADVSEQAALVNYSLEESHANESLNSSSSLNMSSSSPSKIVPPAEILPIMQKMAEYVAKNGEDFETIVKSKHDERFDFLEQTSQYHKYYLELRNEAKIIFKPSSKEEGIKSPSSANELNPSSDDQTVKLNEESYLPALEQVNSPLAVQVQDKPPEDDEFDAIYAQDSQDKIFGPQLENESNSVDSVDSVGFSKDTKSKTKVLKGPISFSLKPKETDAPPAEKPKIPLLLDDSDEDSNEESKERLESSKKWKSMDDNCSASNSRHESVEKEEKPKPSVEMEAKLAEERIKDKLFAAARERLVQQKKEKRLEMERLKREEELKKEKQLQIEQQRKEKQLQLERKKKAALFLKMLKKRNPELDTIAGRMEVEKKSRSEKRKRGSSKNGVLFTAAKSKAEDSDSSTSEESGEEIMITEFCSNPELLSQTASEVIPATEPTKVSDPVKREHKKKKKKHSRSRSQDRHPKAYRSKDRHRSRSPKNYKHEKSKKEKELPAAYALVKPRSRSRSRSPRRYRQNPSYWNRRR